ncbi:hypothetical protein FOZ63_021254 [Perkinsus olseni]|uniref:Uncharacterized protein n=1 Tax=Perkinsus olseni TaxID=32597 RepID=A0A7J6SMN5_PEROL|nr:hypothetical protein FOZ63_021254 [Perkinsus olseni]
MWDGPASVQDSHLSSVPMTIQNTTDGSLKNIGEGSAPPSLLMNATLSDTSSSDSESSVSTPRAEGPGGRPNFGPVPKVDDLLSRVKTFLSTPAAPAAAGQANCDPEVVRDASGGEVRVREESSQPTEQAVEIDVTAGVFDVRGDANTVEVEMRRKNVPVVAAKGDEGKLIEEMHDE